ncbi:MAG: hypothetical protein R2822_23810 [Spirosomataceae bacterium]
MANHHLHSLKDYQAHNEKLLNFIVLLQKTALILFHQEVWVRTLLQRSNPKGCTVSMAHISSVDATRQERNSDTFTYFATQRPNHERDLYQVRW